MRIVVFLVAVSLGAGGCKPAGGGGRGAVERGGEMESGGEIRARRVAVEPGWVRVNGVGNVVGKSGYEMVRFDQMNGWALSIRGDGSGFVEYGSTAGDRQDFPPGTFDFDAVVETVKARLPGKRLGGGVVVGLMKPGVQTTIGQRMDDRGMVIRWMREVLDMPTDRPNRLEEIWGSHPPGANDSEDSGERRD
jgi:hypothetical protein